MLPDRFRDRLRQIMAIKIEDFAKEAREEFSRASADAARRGFVSPSSTHGIQHKVNLHLIEKRVDAALKAEKQFLSSLQIPFSDTLADDLKKEVELYASEEWCQKLLDSNPPIAEDLSRRFKEELIAERNFKLRRAGVEIDMLTDSVRAQQGQQPLPAPKEVAQKFGILWSPGQAEKDFLAWQEQLKESGSIAVMFVDIDFFKQLNTRFTESRIDGSLLPEVQRLFKCLVTGRGDAYHQGGDEFIIILPNVDASEAMQFAEKLRHVFENQKFVIDQQTVPITLSIGVALWPNHGASYVQVTQKANEAEHESKAKRNCAMLASSVRALKLLPGSGLSDTAQRLAVLMCSKSANGLEHDMMVETAALCKELVVSEKDLTIAADELKDRGWIKNDPGIRTLWPTPRLFVETDASVKGWNPASDAKQLAAKLLSKPGEESMLAALGAELSWEPRRLNSAASFLDLHGLITTSRVMSPEPFVFNWMKASVKTHRFVETAS